MNKRNSGISWIKKSEPKFIRDFKERIAYKEQATVETKKKKLDSDLIIEKEEDKPQVVQLKSGDLGEKEYNEYQDKQEILNSASSFGKILFKKPNKKRTEETEPVENSVELTDVKKKTEIDLIFNLNEKGEEQNEPEKEEQEEQEEEKSGEEKIEKKKIYLENEQEEEKIKYGLQQPPVKKRFIDGPTSKVTNLSASKVLAREAKSGNKKLLSFYEEEQEEQEEFNKLDFEEKLKKKELQEEEED